VRVQCKRKRIDFTSIAELALMDLSKKYIRLAPIEPHKPYIQGFWLPDPGQRLLDYSHSGRPENRNS